MLTDKKSPYSNPEIWGGIECTINRINDEFRDQLSYAGHYLREGDIDRIASLGIKAIRYPVLWERHQPIPTQAIDWTWTANQLNKLRHHGIIPIAGLVHHGSGPMHTHLLDEQFPEQLAAYASGVAEQFPWLEYYTPVNEPLTTARFSGLYGLWYPHSKDEHSFMVMLLNQLKGTVLSMQAIRKVNPIAKLVQTEDLAKTHSTELLRYQAAFENERRWLTYDLLCGKVDKEHVLWKYFVDIGINRASLQFFLDNPCPPDIMGLNYYVTSERYLDERLQHYPLHTHGGNGKHLYADVEAVRVTKQAGIKPLLKEAWDRYQFPISLTEVYLNCTREEQLRWFHEIWNEACKAKKEGIDIRAVTAWSLLGSTDWSSLLTKNNGHYETGVFDTRNNQLSPTAMVTLVQSLVKYGKFDHPLLKQHGWWHRNERFLCHIEHKGYKDSLLSGTMPIIIFGTRTLGNIFANACKQRCIPFMLIVVAEQERISKKYIDRCIKHHNPWAIINILETVEPQDASAVMDTCFTINTNAVKHTMQDPTKKDDVPCLLFSFPVVRSADKYQENLTDMMGRALDQLIDSAVGCWPVKYSINSNKDEPFMDMPVLQNQIEEPYLALQE